MLAGVVLAGVGVSVSANAGIAYKPLIRITKMDMDFFIGVSLPNGTSQ